MAEGHQHVKVSVDAGRDINLPTKTLPDGEETTLSMEEYRKYQRSIDSLEQEGDLEVEVLDFKKTG